MTPVSLIFFSVPVSCACAPLANAHSAAIIRTAFWYFILVISLAETRASVSK
jgi:hypothetical protein